MARSGRRIRIFSALEVANICGVVNQTAINWIRNGHLKAFTTPGGQYRIYAKDLAAFLDNRGMSGSDEVLKVMMGNANWNTFLIAADQFANVSLYSELEKALSDYRIIQAFDWFEIGRKLTQAKPGFVLLDASLSGVDISKFLRTVKEDPFFGRPCVFVLTDDNSPFGSKDADSPGARSFAGTVLTKPLDTAALRTAMTSFEKSLMAAIA